MGKASNMCCFPFKVLKKVIELPNHCSIVLSIIAHDPENLDICVSGEKTTKGLKSPSSQSDSPQDTQPIYWPDNRQYDLWLTFREWMSKHFWCHKKIKDIT